MHGPEARRAGRNYCLYGRRFVSGGFALRLSFRYLGKEEGNHDCIGDMVGLVYSAGIGADGRRVIGSTLICASQNIGMLIVGRFINGVCVGICSAQVPVYISELAPPSKRGRLVGAQQWAITWGIMIMF